MGNSSKYEVNILSKYEDLIGFIEQFMNWAAFHLGNKRGAPRSCTTWKAFVSRNWVEQENY